MDKEIREWIKIILISIVLSLILTIFISPTLVKGMSMEPTLHENDYLIMDKISYKLRDIEFGDIVVFEKRIVGEYRESKYLIKRVIGLPGDKIVIENNKLIRNGKTIDKNTVGNMEVKIPEDKLFVLGDNRDHSLDSRSPEVGLVDYEDLKGTILLRVFPLDNIGEVK